MLASGAPQIHHGAHLDCIFFKWNWLITANYIVFVSWSCNICAKSYKRLKLIIYKTIKLCLVCNFDYIFSPSSNQLISKAQVPTHLIFFANQILGLQAQVIKVKKNRYTEQHKLHPAFFVVVYSRVRLVGNLQMHS